MPCTWLWSLVHRIIDGSTCNSVTTFKEDWERCAFVSLFIDSTSSDCHCDCCDKNSECIEFAGTGNFIRRMFTGTSFQG